MWSAGLVSQQRAMVCGAQDVHPQLWKGANRKFDRVPWRRIEAERHNAERTPEQQVPPRPLSPGPSHRAYAPRSPLGACVHLCAACCAWHGADVAVGCAATYW